MGVGWSQVSADCAWTYAEYTESSSAGDGHTWVVTIQCGNGGICAEHVECVENGEEGFVHDVYMDGTDVGDVCVPESQIQEVDVAALAIRAFKNYDWPASALVVQPPGGKTLVNLETNFYTTDNQVITRSVTVAGRNVTLRATPTYTFHFGDDSSTTTASPGRPHPDLDVTHTYASTGDVVVSLDTTYSGEFRIGDGDWQAIPDTLTVAGPGFDLQVVEALPQLVIR
ncbi:hypothetical protein EUA93_10755 [Nocardioides oleivorans]|uniref:PKD domain-containing protein n=1 Tax=Nocardioides oleivorans TaxID=273676 RepID=A0A4Q2S303_9ACTN|nr:hypothetical protein [Nocardioides oleivorans]RYB94785.1 hypothetical protein EUA93_10755 [Nocardioides oleivorans]